MCLIETLFIRDVRKYSKHSFAIALKKTERTKTSENLAAFVSRYNYASAVFTPSR